VSEIHCSPSKSSYQIIFKQRQSLYLNKYIETKNCLSIINDESEKTWIKEKDSKKTEVAISI